MEFLEDWKKADVTPVLKKDKKEDLRSYGPVSFISMLVKLMDQIILKTISKHAKDIVCLGVGRVSS